MSLYDYFQKIDLLSSVVGLRYKGSWRYKSFIGGIVSFIYIIVALSLATYFMVKYVNRDDVFMSFENIKNSNPPQLDISKNFYFAVSMRYGNKNILRKEIMDIQFQYVSYNLTSNMLMVTNIPSYNCTDDSFKGVKEQFYTFGLNESLCIDTSNLTVQGSNINNFYSYIRINFILCSNTTANNFSCLPWTQAQSIIDSTKPLANLYFLDSTFQPKDPDNFLIRFINNINVNITSGNAKETNVYFSNDQLNVEQGYLYTLPSKIYNSYVIQSFRDLVSVRASNQLNSLSFNLMSSKYQSITYVSYLKFSTFLANVGGILQSILIILNIFVYYINNHYFDAECMKSFYRINNQRAFNQKKIINSSEFFHNYVNLAKKTPDYNEDKSFDENLDVQSKNSPLKSQINDPSNLHNKSELDQIYKKDFSSVLSRDIIPKNYDNYEKRETENHKNTNEVQVLNINDRLSTIPVSQFKSENNQYKKLGTLSNKHFTSQKNDLVKSDLNGKLMISSNKILVNLDQSELLRAMLCPFMKTCSNNRKEKLDLHHKLKKFLKSNLDLTNIVKKLMEIDMIKFLVLDDDQLVLSKLIMKPQVCFMPKEDINQITKYNSFSDFYNTNFSQYLKDENFFIPNEKCNMEIFLKSLENVRNKKHLNEIDRKLLMNMKEIFD